MDQTKGLMCTRESTIALHDVMIFFNVTMTYQLAIATGMVINSHKNKALNTVFFVQKFVGCLSCV